MKALDDYRLRTNLDKLLQQVASLALSDEGWIELLCEVKRRAKTAASTAAKSLEKLKAAGLETWGDLILWYVNGPWLDLLTSAKPEDHRPGGKLDGLKNIYKMLWALYDEHRWTLLARFDQSDFNGVVNSLYMNGDHSVRTLAPNWSKVLGLARLASKEGLLSVTVVERLEGLRVDFSGRDLGRRFRDFQDEPSVMDDPALRRGLCDFIRPHMAESTYAGHTWDENEWLPPEDVRAKFIRNGTFQKRGIPPPTAWKIGPKWASVEVRPRQGKTQRFTLRKERRGRGSKWWFHPGDIGRLEAELAAEPRRGVTILDAEGNDVLVFQKA